MKKFPCIFMLALLTFGGCKDYDDSFLRNEVNDLNGRVAALEQWAATVNSNITALQGVITASQEMNYVTGVTPFASPAPGGYIISFLKGETIAIFNGTDGKDGESPQISVQRDADGVYCWTLNGEWILVDGNRMRVTENGTGGQDGVTPQLRINSGTGIWEVSYDEGGTWLSLGVKATGADGQDGVTPQLRVNAGTGIWEVSYNGGSAWTSLGVAAAGAGGQDGVTPQLRINSGTGMWEVSYTNGTTWLSLGVRATGADGQNGVTPQLRVNAGTGIWEVSYNGGAAWLSLGVAAAGAGGKDGRDGISPMIRINTAGNIWEISCNNGESWESTGIVATGAKGDKGDAGARGDAIFAANGVDYSKSDCVEFTLADGVTKIRVPKYAKLGLNFTQPGTFAAGETKTVEYVPEGNVAAIEFLNVPPGWEAVVDYPARAFTVTAPAAFNSSNREGKVILLISDSDQNLIMRTVHFVGGDLPEIASGITGDCVWRLTGVPGNYTLTISGNGAMGNYDFNWGNRPWDQYRENIKTIVIQDGVTAIGGLAFAECSGLASVSIGNSVETISNSAFHWCSSVTAIQVDAANAQYSSENGVLFNKDKTTLVLYPARKTGSYIIPNSVTTIGDGAFSGCYSLTSVGIPNSVITIGSSAFGSCNRLTSVSIPNSVTTIGNGAFGGCNYLTSVSIGNSVTTIGDRAFSACGLTSVSIPNSATMIGDYAFLGCRNLTAIRVDAANAQYSSENGVLFNKDKTTLVYCPEGKTGGYVIPNSVTTISGLAFSRCSGLTSVSIGNSVTTIGQQAFYLCSGLTSVTIGNSVTTIGRWAFGGCSSLTTFQVDAANARYSSENGVLFNKNKTTLVYCPEGKTGGYVIPNSVTTIDIYAFQDCSGLTSVIIGNSVTTIGGVAFAFCSGLTSVIIGNSVKTIGIQAFYNCSGLISVTIGNSVKTIGVGAFSGCGGLTSVTNLSATPQSINSSSVFDGVNISACMLKVPASAVSTYKAAPGWSGFGNITANE